MTIEEAAGLVVTASKELGIPIMVVGSLSSNYYGIPRSTNDADLVVELTGGQLQRLAAKLQPTLTLDPQPVFESVTGTTKYLFHVSGHPFVVELFELSDDPFDRERFARRRPVTLYGCEVWVPSPEDVIIMKLRWYARARRGKDWDDLRSVVAVQGGNLNWDYMAAWCDRHGSREHLDRLRESLPASGS